MDRSSSEETLVGRKRVAQPNGTADARRAATDVDEREARRLERERRRREAGRPTYGSSDPVDPDSTVAPRPWSAPSRVERHRGPGSRLAGARRHLHLSRHFGANYLKKYYLDTYLGLVWIPLLPVLDILMRALLFGGFLGVPSGDRPYLVFLLVGSIGWYFYDRTTLWSYRSLQFNRRYFRSVPVPWLPAVTGAVVPGAVQGALYALIALVVCTYYRVADGSFYVSIGGGFSYAVLGLLLLLLYAWTLGLLFAPLVRIIRDVRVVLRYVFAFWYMLTPILYSVQSIPPRYQAIAVFNPLTAPVEWIRHGLLGTPLPTGRSVVTSLIALAVLLPAGVVLFARAERAAHARL